MSTTIIENHPAEVRTSSTSSRAARSSAVRPNPTPSSVSTLLPGIQAAGVTVKKVLINPELAKQHLTKNTKNRPLTESHVTELEREFVAGRIKFNGDPIRFDSAGNLIDGQHRLEACVRSGVPFYAIVIEGLDQSVFDTIDCGRLRTAGDVLALRNEEYPVKLAATLRMVESYNTGTMRLRVKFSNTEVEEILKREPGVRVSVKIVADLAKDTRLLVPFPILAGLHYLFSRVDATLAQRVIDHVITGHTDEPGGPIHNFRERMVQNSLRRHRLQPGYVAAIFIKAWNQLRAGEKDKPLTFRYGGDSPEGFPEIK